MYKEDISALKKLDKYWTQLKYAGYMHDLCSILLGSILLQRTATDLIPQKNQMSSLCSYQYPSIHLETEV